MTTNTVPYHSQSMRAFWFSVNALFAILCIASLASAVLELKRRNIESSAFCGIGAILWYMTMKTMKKLPGAIRKRNERNGA
jgi:ABC-type polysaccharide/polyol phosphate export permease